MTSAGNTSRVGEAKKIIASALVGLLIALITWLILYVLNPDLVRVNINLNPFAVDAEYGGGEVYDGSGGGYTPRPPGEPGSCGGMALKDAQPAQCELASGALSGMLECMKSNGLNGPINAITSKKIGGDATALANCCDKSKYNKALCGHSRGSCHYGCFETPPRSHAVDYDIIGNESDAQLCKIAEIAHSCGAGRILGPRNISCANGAGIKDASGHEGHLHIPTAQCGK